MGYKAEEISLERKKRQKHEGKIEEQFRRSNIQVIEAPEKRQQRK